MVASVFVQRTNGRTALLFVIAILASITVICAIFALSGVAIPEWFVIVGRWLPAIVAVVVAKRCRVPGGPLEWFALRPGGWRRLMGGGALAVVTLVAVYAVSVVPLVASGMARLQPWSALIQVALLLVPMVLLFSLSTLGEEAAWRGFLQGLLQDKGFWPSSAIIAAVWVCFHIPLHATMAAQGTLPALIAVTSTLTLFPLGLFLSAVVARFASVWPAVFAHALPFSAMNLLADARDLDASALWLLTALTSVVLIGAAWLFALRARV